VTRAASPKLVAYATLGGLGLLAALVTGRPELAAIALPFLAVLGAALVLAADPQVEVESLLERDRLLEGDEVGVELELSARHAVQRAEVLLVVPPALALVEGRNPVATYASARKPATVDLRLRPERWGVFDLRDVHVRARDFFGMFVWTSHVRGQAPEMSLRVYPRPEALPHLLRPAETQLFSGDELSRRKGEGIEFADLRPFAFGDQMRRVNWRASARRGDLWVNEQHPERNADVVIFLDSFAEARRGAHGTIEPAVRAASALTGRYLRRRDRVGLVSFGGTLRWLVPGFGNHGLP